MIEGALFALSIGTIISGYFYFLACRHIRDLKSEICSLTIMVSKNKDLICSYDSYLESISNSTKDRVKNLETIMHENKEKTGELSDLLTECQDQALSRIEVIEKLLHGFCMMKMPTIEEQDRLYQKIKRDITDFKKGIASQERKLDKIVQDVDKRVKGTLNHVASIDNAMQKIKRENIDDFNEYRDMVEQEIKQNNEMVFRRIEDIARDFHVLLTKVKDGSFKEMKILSEDEYLRLKKLK